MSDSICTLLPNLQSGDEDAACAVFDRFAGRLLQLAKSRLELRIRSTNDEEDVMQSVWRSFFRRQQQGEFHFEDWDEVWSLLVLMTVRRCARTANAARAAKRDVNRVANMPAEDSFHWQAMDRQPTPDEVVELSDLVINIMESLEPRQRTIFTMRMQGFSVEEISAQVNRTERTVLRTLALIRDHLR
ncbi:MAG: hypothetical protein KDB00_17230 [Planctomycetales bacterium]|nr:hypothetical protein [Planctomycetales bacterium]